MATGSIKVTITVPVTGAQWSIDNGSTWNNSDDVVQNVSVGNVTIQFNAVAGYYLQPSQTAAITSNNETDVTVSYTSPLTAIQLASIVGWLSDKKWLLFPKNLSAFGGSNDLDLRVITRVLKDVPQKMFDLLEMYSKTQTTNSSLIVDGMVLTTDTNSTWTFGSCGESLREEKNDAGGMEKKRDFYEVWWTGSGMDVSFSFPQLNESPRVTRLIQSKNKAAILAICAALPSNIYNHGMLSHDAETGLFSLHLSQFTGKTNLDYVNILNGHEIQYEETHDRLGLVWQIIYDFVYTENRDVNLYELSQGYDDYVNAGPKSFRGQGINKESYYRPKGNGHYEWKAYTGCTTTVTEITATYYTDRTIF